MRRGPDPKLGIIASPVLVGPLVDEHAAAVYLGLSVHTLRAWRSQGTGPSFHRLGRRIRYSTTGLNEFLRQTLVVPTTCDGKS